MFKKTQVVIGFVAIALVAACPQAARAQTNEPAMGLFAVGGSIGVIDPEYVGSSIGFALHADLGQPIAGMYLFPRLSYWSKSGEVYGARYKVGETGLGADLRYYVNPDASTMFYVGGGAGLYFARGESDFGQGHDTSVGISLLGGFDTPVSQRAQVFGEARYKIDDNFDTFGIAVGLSVDMPR